MRGTLLVVALALGCEAPPSAPPAPPPPAPPAERAAPTLAERLVALTNDARTTRGLPPLHPDERLGRAARLKAEDMARRGYFAHVGPDGRSAWSWVKGAGYAHSIAAENLHRGSADPELIHRSWMTSDVHRANLLAPSITDIGVGAVATGPQSAIVVAVMARPEAARPSP
jgi:uncharacterized protein YkwD